MNRHLTTALFGMVMLPLVCKGAAAAACVVVDFEGGDADKAIWEKKVDYAIAAIADVENQKKDANCIAANMRYLGLAHAESAIPTLISLLGFHLTPDPHKFYDFNQYPALSALRNIGQPALPALIEVVASKEN